MRRALGRVWRRPVLTFEFGRYTVWDESAAAVAVALKILQRLQAVRRMCGVIVATPTALKALLLRFVELSRSAASDEACRTLACVLRMFSHEERGCLLLDEVDVCLHPLKSELNFPIGGSVPLALAPERWELVMWVVAALDPAGRAASLQGRSGSERARGVGARLHALLQALAAARRVQYMRPRGLLLVDAAAYGAVLPALAEWTLLWLRAEFDGGRCARMELPTAGVGCAASSSRDASHAAGAVLATDGASFWCSADVPGTAWLELSLPATLGARLSSVHITYEPLSSFVCYRCAVAAARGRTHAHTRTYARTHARTHKHAAHTHTQARALPHVG
jgi:hypothetical protein